LFTRTDVDANVRVIYLRDERILGCQSVGVARCRLPRKKVDFFLLKAISDITVELQVPLSTLFSSVILHDYVQHLRKVEL